MGRCTKFTGRTPNPFDAVDVFSGTLIIENGSTLAVGNDPILGIPYVRILGGKLATQATGAATQGQATIEAKLSIQGNNTVIVISDTTLNPAGVQGHKYGHLVVTEDIVWWEGTFKPTIDGATGSSAADVWRSKKKFKVDTTLHQNSQLKIDPIVVNAPAGGMVSGQVRRIMEADGGFVVVDKFPSFPVPQTWELLQNAMNPVTEWSIKKK